MYLFTRQTRLNSAAGMEWATNICAKATTVGGNPVQLWGSVLSPGLGTISWSSWHADLVSLETALDKLQVDPGFQALAAEGANHTEGGFDDGVVQIIHGEPDLSADPQYVTSVQAVLAGGQIARGIAAGVEIAQKAEAATGGPTLFGQTLSGSYGGIGWITGHQDIAALEAANNALAADANFLSFLDSLQGVFVEDASITQQRFFRKLA